MKPNGNISSEWAKVLSFVWEKVLFHREVIYVFLLITLRMSPGKGLEDTS